MPFEISTYCGGFTPAQLAAHLTDCDICAADSYLVSQAADIEDEDA